MKDQLIKQGYQLLEENDYSKLKSAFSEWNHRILAYSYEIEFPKERISEIKVRAHFVENEYSEIDSMKSIKNSIRDILNLLLYAPSVSERYFTLKETRKIIERILQNFPLFMKTMYQQEFHKRSSLSQEALRDIQIRNEYDVQHILYAIFRTIFPDIRKEVNSDNGYGGMRADLFLENLDIIIEVKCTRSSMNEKQLTEELGADAFHYKPKILYLFIYDKEGIIKNPEAYKNSFKRTYEQDRKEVQAFITQPLQL